MEKLKGLLKKEDVTNVLGVSDNEVQEFINVGLLTALSMSSGQIYIPAECVNNLLNPTKKNSGYLSANTLSSTKGDGVMKKSVPNKNGWVQVKDGIFRKEVGKKDYVYKYRICQYDSTGKKIDRTRTLNDERKPFKTVREAETHRNALIKELFGKVEQSSELSTIEQVFLDFRKNRENTLEPGTMSKHIGNVNTHIVPYFGDKHINDVTVGEVKNFMAIKQMELAHSTVEGLLQTLKKIWLYGYEMGVVSRNSYISIFVDDLTKVKIKKTQKDIQAEQNPKKSYKKSELEVFNKLALKKNKLYYILLQICYYGGLRSSEAIGLRWRNVNFDTGEITVHAQVVYNKITHLRYIGPTKNKYDRIFQAPPALINCLREWKHEQEQNKVHFGDAYQATEIYEDTVDGGYVKGGDFILRFENGAHLKHSQANKFKEWLEKETGVHFYYHGLRKTIVSQLHGSGVPVKTVSEYIGHRDVDVTVKYYLTDSEEGQDALQNVINRL